MGKEKHKCHLLVNKVVPAQVKPSFAFEQIYGKFKNISKEIIPCS